MPYINLLSVVSLNMYAKDLYLTVVVFIQSQQPLEDLDAQLRRTLSPETVAVTSAVGVSFENLEL